MTNPLDRIIVEDGNPPRIVEHAGVIVYSTRKTLDYLEISRQTLWRIRSRGGIHGFQIVGFYENEVYYPEDEVKRLKRERTRF